MVVTIMKDIFDECEFGKFTLNNRIIRLGHWERETEDGGFLKPEVFERYERIASSCGAIVSEVFALDSRDKFYKYSTNANYKGFIKDYKEITQIAHKYNVPILGQLAFVNYNDGFESVDVNTITVEGIRRLQAEIIIFAKKLKFAGFDGIQLGIGANFFLNQFISPDSNKRTDDYGGNTLKRTRILLEIIKTIKNTIDDFHVNCRVNLREERKNGMTTEEGIEVCKLLEKSGADSIQITGRTTSNIYDENKRRDFLADIDALIEAIDIPVILQGTFTEMDTMNDILNSSKLEFIGTGKPFIADPDFLDEWRENGTGVATCDNCNNCYSKKSSLCFKY